ncbi:MAG: glycoside hydrolase [Desulfobacterium sp.]|nr:glycoside hydrolase [Desulfobacterium sp.]
MSKNGSKQSMKQKKVTFKFVSPDAENVSLVGNFNDWDKAKHPMKKEGNGVWSKTVILGYGVHQYKFLADDQWVEDPNNEKLAPNEFGTLNNIIDVK